MIELIHGIDARNILTHFEKMIPEKTLGSENIYSGNGCPPTCSDNDNTQSL